MRPLARQLESLDRSQPVRWACIAALVTLGLWSLAGLADSYYEYAFEADSEATVALVLAFGELAWTGSLPRPTFNIPYFDGQYWIYAVGYVIAKAARALELLDAAQLPTSQSLAVFAVRYGNVLAHLGAAVLAFLTAARLSRSTLLATVLGLLFLFDPQMVGIDLMRIDRVILFLIVLVFALSLEVAAGRRNRFLDILLGAAAAFLVSTKVTSVVFLAIPVFAYLRDLRAARLSWRNPAVFLASLVVAGLLINARYFVDWRTPGKVVAEVLAKLDALALWGGIVPRTPWLYYNWDAFAPLGAAFMAVFLVALAASVWGLARRREPRVWMVLFSLVFLSALGIAAYKYPRGGYALVPLYLYVIAYGAAHLRDLLAAKLGRLADWSGLVVLAACGALLWPLGKAWTYYERVRHEATFRDESIRATRVAPREWMRRNVPAGARVIVFRDSQWADPPIFDLGYAISAGFLDFPYFDSAAMGRFAPPDLSKLPGEADVIVLNDYHQSVYPYFMKNFGHAQMALAWAAFFDELVRRYPHHRFEAKHPNYDVRRVDIVVLNPKPPVR